MIHRRRALGAKKAKKIKDGLDYPKIFSELVPYLYENGFDCYDFGLVFYVINKGQTGIHKVRAVFTDYRQAKDYLDGMDKELRPHTEVRVGFMIEGHPLA